MSDLVNEDDTNAVKQNVTRSAQSYGAVEAIYGVEATHLYLSLSCKDLINVDIGSLSDPFTVVKYQQNDESWKEIGRTEIKANNLSPEWVKLIPVDYFFEKVQYLKFEVYDVSDDFRSSDASALKLEEQTCLGIAVVPLAVIVNNQYARYTLPLRPQVTNAEDPKPKLGTITIQAEEVAGQNIEISLKLGIQDLPKVAGKMGLKSNPNPFLIISRTLEMGITMRCYQTESIKGTTNPIWDELKESLGIFSAGDIERPLKIEVFSWRKDGNHRLLCHITTSMRRILDLSGSKLDMTLENPKGRSINPVLHIISSKKDRIPTFFDYLNSGLELQFVCAIDYTTSNGDPLLNDSLHHIGQDGFSPYSKTISEIGKVLEFYDTDKKFPVFGFGGKQHGKSYVEHSFAVNGKENDPEVIGVAGILSLYQESLHRIVLSGPTLFAPLINRAALLAESLKTNNSSLKYVVLLILTDGIVDDMLPTKDAIFEAAKLPMSIIIVGIGSANFSCMVELDGDDERVCNSKGEPAVRDIVQFVPYEEIKKKGIQQLAEEVLQELPSAVVEYFTMKTIMPLQFLNEDRAANQKVYKNMQQQHSEFKRWEESCREICP